MYTYTCSVFRRQVIRHVFSCNCYFLELLNFFFNYTATTEIYTLSLHDALPISTGRGNDCAVRQRDREQGGPDHRAGALLAKRRDRKSTRLNSSHMSISYAVFCLKKKNNNNCLST